MVGDEVEILFLEKPVSYSGHHLCVIAVGKHRNQNADRHGAAIAQGSCKETGLIVEFERRLANSLPCSFRNGASRQLIQNDRYGRRIKIEIRRESLETDGFSREVVVTLGLSHRTAVTSTKYQPGAVDKGLSIDVPSPRRGFLEEPLAGACELRAVLVEIRRPGALCSLGIQEQPCVLSLDGHFRCEYGRARWRLGMHITVRPLRRKVFLSNGFARYDSTAPCSWSSSPLFPSYPGGRLAVRDQTKSAAAPAGVTKCPRQTLV